MHMAKSINIHPAKYKEVDENIIILLKAININTPLDTEEDGKILADILYTECYNITKKSEFIWSLYLLANKLYKNKEIKQSHLLYNYILNQTNSQLADNFCLHFENNKTYYSMYNNILKRKILDVCEHPDIIASIQNEENKYHEDIEEESKYCDSDEKNTAKQYFSLQNQTKFYLNQFSNLLDSYRQTPEPDVNMITKIKWTKKLCLARSLLPNNFKNSQNLFELCLGQKDINTVASISDQCYALYLLTICYLQTRKFRQALETAKKIDDIEGSDDEASEYIFKILADRAYIKGLCYFHEENYSAAYNEFKTSTSYSASNKTIGLQPDKINIMFFLMTIIKIKERNNTLGIFKEPYDKDQSNIELDNIIKEIKYSADNIKKIKNTISFLFADKKKQLIDFAAADKKIEYLFADVIKCIPKHYTGIKHINLTLR